VKNKSLVVAASFALLMASGVPAAFASTTDQPWCTAVDFIECLVQGVLNVL
jgi:hypothetical protein